MNISMLLDVAAGLAPEQIAFKDSEKILTTRSLQEAALSLAARLKDLEHAGPVAYINTNSIAFAIGLFGAAYAGRSFAPLNYRADAKLMEHYMTVLRPGVVIAGPRYMPLVPSTTTAWDVQSLFEATKLPAGLPEVAEDAAAVRIMTSGTTSAPKAATLYHRNLVSYVLNSTEPMSEAHGSTLIATPNYHIATVANVLTSTYSCRRVCFLDSFTPQSWLEAAEREGITHAFVVPTMLQRIVDVLKAGGQPPRGLKTLAYGGSAASLQTVEGALTLFSADTGFVNAYGLTETSSTVSILTPDDHRAAFRNPDPGSSARLRSVGRPLPGVEVSISPEGEILVRGPQVSGSYSDGGGMTEDWFHTGDLGHVDSEGYLFIEGRMDDMIIRGGENISPLEIENAIKENSEVADAAVVGVSDPEWGQRIAAAVELRTQITPAELAGRLVGRLPSFKRPETIVVVDELPRTDLGKLQRRKVRARLEGNVETTIRKGSQ